MDQLTVTYDTISTIPAAQALFDSLPDTIALDFEVATRYTPAERASMQATLDNDPPKRERIAIEQALRATALDHPYHCTVTHMSLAFSTTHGYTFIFDTPELLDYVMSFLVTTPIRQVWHNASYDFRLIYFHTRKFPRNYEDTQILSKTLINHCNTFQARTGLKELAGHMYGAWGISSDNFDLANLHDPHVHLYAAIDACATFFLWTNLQSRFSQGAPNEPQ